jgi:tetratricopeptide (TPR) repeat protein
LRANELFPTDPAAAITLYTQALSLAPHDAPILANRSAAYLKIQKWPEAYQDACQALDESGRVTGMDGELRVKCVVRAGEACIGAEVWDIAVIVSRSSGHTTLLALQTMD